MSKNKRWKETMKKCLTVVTVVCLALTGGAVLLFRWNAKTASDHYGEYVEQGMLCMQQEIYRDAITWFEKAESICADENVQVAIAECYQNLGDSTSFQAKASQIEKTYGINERLYQDLACYYRQMRDTAGEIAVLKQGVADYPEDAALRASYDAVKGDYTEAGTQVEQVACMVDDYTIVQTETGWQVLNSALNKVGTQTYERIYDLSADACIAEGWADAEMLYSAKKDGVISYYDQKGYRRRSPDQQYAYLGAFRNGYALVQSQNGWGYIDMEFHEQPVWYEDATSFADGMAAVKQDGKWSLIDTEFEPISDAVYDDIVVDACHRCSVGGTAFARKGETYIMVTKEGEQEGSYEQVQPFLEEGGYAACYSEESWKLINGKGETIEVAGCESLTSSSRGIAGYRKGDAYGFVSTGDGIYTEPVFAQVGSVNENGYAAVCEDTGWSFIHFTGMDKKDSLF